MSLINKQEVETIENNPFVTENIVNELYDKIKLENIDILISNYGHFQRMNILLRKPYTVSEYYTSNTVYYKLYVKQGPAVIYITDWEIANKAMNNNYFTLDTTWMVPQEYFVDIKVETNGETLLFDSELNFHIVNRVK